MNPASPSPSRRAAFFAGARAILPLIIGAIPFGIIYGALAVTAGLRPAEALGMSLIVFAGSAQFIAVGLIAQGATAAVIILTTFVVNLRHALYAASLAPHMRGLPQRWLLPLGFWLTDEAFATVIGPYQRRAHAPHDHWFHLGAALAMYLNWQLMTLIGIVAGTQLPDPASWGLDFAMVVTFIGMVAPLVRGRPMIACVVVSAVVAVAAYGLPNQLWLMLASLAGISAGLISEAVWPRVAAEAESAA